LKKRNSGLSGSGSGDDAADLSRSQAGPGRGLCPPACRDSIPGHRARQGLQQIAARSG
jgi:hypothetical protein